MRIPLLEKIESLKPFTEPQAWTLFRFAAFGETFGWTVLIFGIMLEHSTLPGHAIAVPIAGSLHGTFFLIYFFLLIGTYSSLNWSRGKFLVGLASGVPPFGALAFELWAAPVRQRALLRTYRQVVVRGVIRKGESVLAVQSSGSVTWDLPGGYAVAGEELPEGLVRVLRDLTGVSASVGRQLGYAEAEPGGEISVYFEVENSRDFAGIDLAEVRRRNSFYDEVRFVSWKDTPGLPNDVVR